MVSEANGVAPLCSGFDYKPLNILQLHNNKDFFIYVSSV